MKKIFLTVLAVATSAMMFADLHFGVEAGYDYFNTVNSSKMQGTKLKESDGMSGFHVGANIEYGFWEQGAHGLSATAGLNYQFLGEELMDKEDIKEAKQEWKDQGFKNPVVSDFGHVHSFNLPLHIKYNYQINNDWGIHAFTGPQFHFTFAICETYKDYATMDGKKTGAIREENVITGKWKETIWRDGDKNVEKGTRDAHGHWFDASWGLGVGASWQNLSLSLSYDFGLRNHAADQNKKAKERDKGDYVRQRNDCLQLTIGYRIF